MIGTFHLTIGTYLPKEKSHVIIMDANTTLHIACILVMSPKLGRPRRSAQLVGVVVETMVEAEVDTAVETVEEAKVTARSRATVISMGI